jgi:hypothetical protein
MEDFVQHPADDAAAGDTAADGVDAADYAADGGASYAALDYSDAGAQAGPLQTFDPAQDYAPPDLQGQDYAAQPPHVAHHAHENAHAAAEHADNAGNPFQTDYPQADAPHAQHVSHTHGHAAAGHGEPTFGGYGGCYRCGCRAFEGNDVVCGNCGHSYGDH